MFVNIAADLVLFLLTGAGHLAIWVRCFNRIHATAWPRVWIKRSERIIMTVTAVLPLLILSQTGFPRPVTLGFRWDSAALALAHGYILACWMMWLVVSWGWLRLQFDPSIGRGLIAESAKKVNVVEVVGHRPVGSRKAALASMIPGNEILSISVTAKELWIPKLPREFERLTIAHLSDLHLTGQMTEAFYETVLRLTQQLNADLIALTGDIVDKPECIEWLESLFAEIKSPLGNYFILGNHDTRVSDPQQIRNRLSRVGWRDCGHQMFAVRQGAATLQIAGNERPWFGHVDLPERTDADLRLVLSHSPDQMPWARQHETDLVLAGHNHGGQIRVPMIGAIVCPSRYGVRYPSGVFHESPTTLHVSRGVSGVHPLRWNCPPEISLLTLTRSLSVEPSREVEYPVAETSTAQ